MKVRVVKAIGLMDGAVERNLAIAGVHEFTREADGVFTANMSQAQLDAWYNTRAQPHSLTVIELDPAPERPDPLTAALEAFLNALSWRVLTAIEKAILLARLAETNPENK